MICVARNSATSLWYRKIGVLAGVLMVSVAFRLPRSALKMCLVCVVVPWCTILGRASGCGFYFRGSDVRQVVVREGNRPRRKERNGKEINRQWRSRGKAKAKGAKRYRGKEKGGGRLLTLTAWDPPPFITVGLAWLQR